LDQFRVVKRIAAAILEPGSDIFRDVRVAFNLLVGPTVSLRAVSTGAQSGRRVFGVASTENRFVPLPRQGFDVRHEDMRTQ
jgi:hypothetical protein